MLNIEITDLAHGSVEIESFSSRNLRIPYSAVMAVYETDNSISMVHSYGRNHSLIELEDNHSLTQGRESCWTLRSAEAIVNRAAFHNGHIAVPAQTAMLILSNRDGQEAVHEFDMPALQPFATYLFEIDDICPNFRQFLDGQDGWATVHFENSTAFTRLLIIWHSPDTNELQVTHSNFDYAEHQTNTLDSSQPAHMKLPRVAQTDELSVTVYPRFMPGNYEATTSSNTIAFDSGLVLNETGGSVVFRRMDGALPARIVTGIIGGHPKATLPFECSFGVIHDQRPPKRFHWAIVSRSLQSRIYLTDYREIYAPGSGTIELVVSLYNASNLDIIKTTLSFAGINELPAFLDPAEIFRNQMDVVGHDFGYVSVFSHYGGLLLFSSMEKNQSFTLEHSF